MADEPKMYHLTCPDEDCEHEFDVALTETALTEGADLIECPICGELWEWEYDPKAGTLELLGDDPDDDLDDLDTGLTCEETTKTRTSQLSPSHP
jgi:hypothetical protein